jgi:hypothetical protein
MDRTIIPPDLQHEGIQCPMGAGFLVLQKDDGEQERDRSLYYVSSENPLYAYSRSPFKWNVFVLDKERPFDLLDRRLPREEFAAEYKKAEPQSKQLQLHGRFKRYFRLEEDGSWTSLIFVANEYRPADIPLDEIIRLIKEYDEEYERRKQQYLSDPEKYGPFAFRLESKTISLEKVQVQPMSPPSGILLYIDHIIEKDQQ